jgi:hypothetical protein
MGKISKRCKKLRPGHPRANHRPPAAQLAGDEIVQQTTHTCPAASIDRNSGLEKESTPPSVTCKAPDHSLHFFDLLEAQSEHAMAPAPRMLPALLRVYEDRVVRVTLLRREDGGVSNLFPSRSSITAARVLLLSAVLALGSALTTKSSRSSLRALSHCALVRNVPEFSAPKQFTPATPALDIFRALSLISAR